MPIEIKKLTHIYDIGLPFEHKALDEVSLTIEDNKVTGIIGSTGSGKSTLIQHFNALIKPTSGTVFVDGVDVFSKETNKKALRQKVGLVFQYPESQLFGETVEKDIAFGPKKMGVSDEQTKERVKKSLEMVGLSFEKYANRSPFNLSGGEKRKVAIAGILALNPSILILDEPTAGLDPSSRNALLRLIKSFREDGKTLVMVSHDMDEIAHISDNVVVMSKSKIIFSGQTSEAFSQPMMLRDAGLDVPALSIVAGLLREKGYDIPRKTWDAKNLASSIKQIVGGVQ